EEASRADAALLVFNATQLASQQELDVVGEMEAKLENLIIAVNRIDDVPPSDWERLRTHVVNRLDQRGLHIPESRVVMVSALMAEEELRAGAPSVWLEHINVLRTLVEQHLFS